MKAGALVESQRRLPLRTCRQMDLVAIGSHCNIERVSKNPSAKSQLTILSVSDHIFNHPI